MLEQLREATATLIAEATGWKKHATLPARLTPPAVIITPGAPYVEPGNTFGTVQVRLVASLVYKTAANEVTSDKLDAAIIDALVAIINEGYSFESVSQPYALEANNGQQLAADITFTITPTL